MPGPPLLTRHYASICNVDHFADPELSRLVEEIDPRLSSKRPHRKGWEFASGALFLRDVGALSRETAVLDVGAGKAPFQFWLTRHVGRVVAVDIYGQGAFSNMDSPADFVLDPAAAAPYDYARERLQVHAMDARRLNFRDAAFDAVVSFSSLEHVGNAEQIAAAAREVGRVLKPGGHAFVVTETFAAAHRAERAYASVLAHATRLGARRRIMQRPGREILTRTELTEHIVAASGLALMQPLELAISPATARNVLRVGPGGTVCGRSAFPHILLRSRGATFTSVCLPLEKPA